MSFRNKLQVASYEVSEQLEKKHGEGEDRCYGTFGVSFSCSVGPDKEMPVREG